MDRILNHTHTAMASRLLRVTLLSPITRAYGWHGSELPLTPLYSVQGASDARLDVVEGNPHQNSFRHC